MLVAVAGARGGIGTTRVAAALARGLGAVLVDTDGPAGGVDLWLGAEEVPGVRWSGLGLAGGALEPVDLIAALPLVGGVRVLAADRAELPEPAPVAQVLEVLAATPVVVDLARRVDAVAQQVVTRAGLVVVLVPAGVAATASAHVLVTALTAAVPHVPLGLVVVGRGAAEGIRAERALPESAVAAAVGAPVLAAVEAPGDLDRAVAGLVDGVRESR